MMKHFLLENLPLREFGILVLMVILTLSTSANVCAQESFSPRSLQAEIFADGVLSIKYTLDVDTTYTSVDLALFGTPLDDIIVLNHRDELLDYELTETGIKIYTLGTYRARILYDTKDLTSEIGGGIWTFHMNSPINVTISLPKEAEVIPNKPPISIETVKDKTILTMPAGDLELVYTIFVPVPVPVPPEIPGVPSDAIAYDHTDIVPADFFKKVPADALTVLMFKNFVLIADSSERLDLSLTVFQLWP